MTGGITSGL